MGQMDGDQRSSEHSVLCIRRLDWEECWGQDLGAILQWTGSHEHAEVAPAASLPAQTWEVLGQACLAFAFQTLYNPTQPPSSSPHCPLHVYNTFPRGRLFYFNKLLHNNNLETRPTAHVLCLTFSPATASPVTWTP